jgi:hypothetical protein
MSGGENGNGWTRAEQMVFYRLDQVDRRLAELKGDLSRAERDLLDKLEHNREDMSKRLNQVMGDLTGKIAALERAHEAQKVKVAALAAGASLMVAGLVSWLFHQLGGAT